MRRLMFIIVLAALTPAPLTHAQTPARDLTAPGSSPLAPRPISFTQAPDGVVALPGDREGLIDLAVIGPQGVGLTLKAVENVVIGGLPASALFSLIEPANDPPAGAPAAGGLAVRQPAPALSASRFNDSVGGADRKRLRYAGAPGVLGAPRIITVDVVAAGGGARAVTKQVRVLIGPDAAPPQIVFAGGGVKDSPSFPPFSGSPANNNDWNIVRNAMEVEIHAKQFSVPQGAVSSEQADVYHVIAEYDDGARFRTSYVGGGPLGAGATRLIATVPNIGRGGFQLALATPLGLTRDARQFTFPDNTFTSHPVTYCPLQMVGVDVPASAPTEDSFWPPTTFLSPALPASPSCGKLYGKWHDVDIERTAMAPAGVASAKIVRRPGVGSIAHDGNMPGFTCSAAGIGTVTIHWRARLKIYTGECANRRVQ